MGVSESADEVTAELSVVERSEGCGVDDRERIAASTADELIALVQQAGDPATVLVVIDDAFAPDGIDDDEFVALASVLVHHGVSAFETCRVQTVRRLFDMHAAIEAGSIEVLG